MTLQKIKDELAELKTLVGNFVSGKTTSEAAARSSESSAFQTRLTAVEASVTSQLAEKDKSISDKDGEITKLKSDLKVAVDKNGSDATEITNLKASVEAEKKKTTDTLSAMGVDPKIIPAPAAPANGPGNAKPDLKGRARMVAAMKIEGVIPRA